MFGSWPIATKRPSVSSSDSLAGDRVAEADGGDVAVAQHLLDRLVEHELDLLVRAGAVDHDRRGAELLAAVDEGHLAREARDEGRLLHRRVAAADHHDVLVAEERGVAGRAVRDAAALERALRLEPELAGGRAGGDDHGLGAVLVVADPHAERPLGEVDARHVVGEELVPNRSAWRRKSCIIAGPRTPSA